MHAMPGLRRCWCLGLIGLANKIQLAFTFPLQSLIGAIMSLGMEARNGRAAIGDKPHEYLHNTDGAFL